jgi:DNA-binding IclR family transcriptional regulator
MTGPDPDNAVRPRDVVVPAADGSEDARRGTVQSVDRAMLLLRAVASASAEDSTATRLAEACGLNRATAWRILHTLEAHGAVSCNHATGRWSIGLAVADLARSAGVDAVIEAARPYLERLSLQTGETAALAVVRDVGLTYVAEVAPVAIVAASWRGRTVPLHATSTGKVLLAFGDHRTANAAGHGTGHGSGHGTGAALESFTDTTVTDPEALAAELELTRRRGYAICRGEYEASAWGVSAPVLDRHHQPVAVLSVWGPASRVNDARFEVLGTLVRDAAAELSGR